MNEKKFTKTFRTAKIIQLCVFLVIDIAAILTLVLNPDIGTEIYSNKILFLLCGMIWILMIFSLVFLLYDFYKLKSFAEESHALNKAAYIDQLTGIPNRHGLDEIFKTYNSPESMAQIGCFMCTISNLRTTNDTQGHAAGNRMILDFCRIFEEIGDSFGFVGRNGGNEFIMVMDSCSHDVMQYFIRTLNEHIAQYNERHAKTPINMEYVYLLNAEEQAPDFTQLLTFIYQKLHS